MNFIDEAKIHVAGGDGGRGCVSFRREKFVPKGGPDGGDGGDGGAVILVADRRITSLNDLRYKHIYKAPRGAHGRGSRCHGKGGEDVVIRVPVGTVVKDLITEELLADLTQADQRYVAVSGGRGGRGNARFATSTNRAPTHAQPGEEAAERELTLELKLLADVGLVGFPNAGKSTLISRISAARPKVADYPFTTLVPNLGVVRHGDCGGFVVADIPGLVEGAHEGKGLGLRFLRHIERTSIFIHMIDLSPEAFDEGRDPLGDYNAVCGELLKFNPELAARPQVVALNKIDLPDALVMADELTALLKTKGVKVFEISAVTGQGLEELVNYIGREVDKHRKAEREEKEEDEEYVVER